MQKLSWISTELLIGIKEMSERTYEEWERILEDEQANEQDDGVERE